MLSFQNKILCNDLQTLNSLSFHSLQLGQNLRNPDDHVIDLLSCLFDSGLHQEVCQDSVKEEIRKCQEIRRFNMNVRWFWV